jgi:hypothetical protein
MSDFAEDLVSTILATTLGIDFDPQKDYKNLMITRGNAFLPLKKAFRP